MLEYIVSPCSLYVSQMRQELHFADDHCSLYILVVIKAHHCNSVLKKCGSHNIYSSGFSACRLYGELQPN